MYIYIFFPNSGLAFDSWDLDYYTSMFQRIQRNPTSVECFDLAQSNRFLFSSHQTRLIHLSLSHSVTFDPSPCSEHSRHWFFRGRMEIDGQEQKETLFSLIMGTQRQSNQNNVIKFCDNSRCSPIAVSVRVCVSFYTASLSCASFLAVSKEPS